MSANFTNFEEVKDLIQLYVDGTNGDVNKLKEAFHPRAWIMGHGEKLGFKGHFPADKFIDILKSEPHMAGANHKVDIRSIDLTDDVGVVVVKETDFHGCDFVDYLSVAKIEGQWFITNKTYTCTGKAIAQQQ